MATPNKKPSNTIDQMQEGFETIEDFCATLELTIFQKLKVQFMIILVIVYRLLIFPFQKKKMQALDQELEALKDIQINIKRNHLKAAPDNHYLTEEAIQAFEKDGMLPPFRVISPEKAAALKKLAYEQFNDNFKGNSYLGSEIEDVLKRNKAWNMSVGGLYQALRLKEFRDLLRMPQIAQRLASLMGEEVLCWRSQFFEKKPNSTGTFWHQNSVFREATKSSKLVPTKEMDIPMIQLTAWVALSDVTIKNGALRLMPGTFKDGRLEYMYTFAQDNLFMFLSQAPISKLSTYLKAAFFSTGSFIRSQVVFNLVLNTLSDLFQDTQILDLEMKAGECVIFTSLNMHASFSNSTEDDTRLAFVGRCTPNHVKVFPNTKTSAYSTPEGVKDFTLPEVSNFQVHGTDSYEFNQIIPLEVNEMLNTTNSLSH
jgi:chlorinating enzyme